MSVNSNNAHTKALHVEYATWMLQRGCGMHRIYIDKSGFNLYISRSRGRSPEGERASGVVCEQREKYEVIHSYK